MLGNRVLLCSPFLSLSEYRTGLVLSVFLITVLPAISQVQTQQQAKLTGSEPTPEPAIPAILAAFDRYEVVAMPEAHGMKDVDDFILSLIRDPTFPEKVKIASARDQLRSRHPQPTRVWPESLC
jgi:hypothetical protein